MVLHEGRETQKENMSTTPIDPQTRYVAGFLFTEDLQRVCLILKQRPAWQKNKLNGVGGKVESWESNDAAMEREFAEETGVPKYAFKWSRYCMLEFPDAIVHFYVAVNKEGIPVPMKETTDEKVGWYSVSSLVNGYLQCLDNIPQLVTLALQRISFDATLSHK